MSKVAPIIGREMSHETFFDKFMELTQCDVPNIRKQCATVFPVMCEVLGCDLLESSMLPLFVKLCDDSSWNIRNACAQIIPMISILCCLSLRRKYLVPIMKKFMFDESRWVITSALNSLGEFLATFAQPPIIGLAYNYRLELFITNAADQDFRQQYQSNMLLYSNQPNSSVIFKNLEYYEKEFEKEFFIGDGQKVRSLSLPNTAAVKLSPIGDGVAKKVNIETYLLSIIKANHFSDRMNTSGGRLSSTTASESDECELFSIQSATNSAALLKRLSTTDDSRDNDDNNNGDDPFSKFLKFNTPLKNNFINRILTPDNVESTFVWHMGFGSNNSENDGVLHNYDYIFKENGSAEQEEEDDDEDDDVTDFEDKVLNKSVKSYDDDWETDDAGAAAFEKKLNNLTLPDKLNNNETSTEEVELEKFNSHQYWYIEPPKLAELEDQNNNAEDASFTADQSTVVMEDDEDNESNDSMKIMNCDSKVPPMTLTLDKAEEEVETPQENNDSAEVEWNLIEDFVYMKVNIKRNIK